MLDNVDKSDIPSLFKDLRTPGSEPRKLVGKFISSLGMSRASSAKWGGKIPRAILADVVSRDPDLEKAYYRRKASEQSTKSTQVAQPKDGAATLSDKDSRATSAPSRSIDSTAAGTSALVAAAA